MDPIQRNSYWSIIISLTWVLVYMLAVMLTYWIGTFKQAGMTYVEFRLLLVPPTMGVLLGWLTSSQILHVVLTLFILNIGSAFGLLTALVFSVTCWLACYGISRSQ